MKNELSYNMNFFFDKLQRKGWEIFLLSASKSTLSDVKYRLVHFWLNYLNVLSNKVSYFLVFKKQLTNIYLCYVISMFKNQFIPKNSRSLLDLNLVFLFFKKKICPYKKKTYCNAHQVIRDRCEVGGMWQSGLPWVWADLAPSRWRYRFS